tara:strand:+ start:1463 stop:1675 length:213 start_codon:yes stop_codon:yes gene_type:complete
MTEVEASIYEEQKKLVLVRLKTLNLETKMMSGGGKSVSVREIIKHVEDDDSFGKDIVKAQMKMLQILARY